MALCQQATCGDCDSGSPASFRIEARAKWGAWEAKRGAICPLSPPSVHCSALRLVLYLPLHFTRVAQHESQPRLAGQDRLLSRERFTATVKDAVPEWLASDTLDAIKQALITIRHTSPQPSPVARGTPDSPLALTLGSIAWDSPGPGASSDWPAAIAGASNSSIASPLGNIAPSISQDRQAPPSDLYGFLNYRDISEADIFPVLVTPWIYPRRISLRF